MKTKLTLCASILIAAFGGASCGGAQEQRTPLQTKPLEENKAFEIIAEILTERGYTSTPDVELELVNDQKFQSDFRVEGHKIAIEYVTDKDRGEIGHIPPAAQGSRLHVIPGRISSPDPHVPGEPIYIFFVDDRKYEYQYNPTSDSRADITYLEVDSRLRRDVADFLSWYESSEANQQ